jgi:hypothetical protein
MAEKTQTINLLPHDSENFMTQFFNWALSIGRLLIILTEMVALATFVYRFSLDSQLVDLHDKIKSESFILDNFQTAENTFVDIQARLAAIQQYSTVGSRTSTIFAAITKMGQQKITFKDLTIDTQDAKIEVESPTVAPLASFVNELKKYPLITSVSIDNVASDPTSAEITVIITAELKTAPFAQGETQTATPMNQSVLNTQ